MIDEIYSFTKSDFEDQFRKNPSRMGLNSLFVSMLATVFSLIGLNMVVKLFLDAYKMPLFFFSCLFLVLIFVLWRQVNTGKSSSYLDAIGVLYRRFCSVFLDMLVCLKFFCVFCAAGVLNSVFNKKSYISVSWAARIFVCVFILMFVAVSLPKEIVPYGVTLDGITYLIEPIFKPVGVFLRGSLKGWWWLLAAPLIFIGVIVFLIFYAIIQFFLIVFISCVVCFVLFNLFSLFSREINITNEVHEFHFSDLHITRTGENGSDLLGIEADELNKVRVKNNLDILSELASSKGKVLLLTGDITDGGEREEWLTVISGLRSKTDASIVMVPGNHDLYPYSKEYNPRLSSVFNLASPLCNIRRIRFLVAAAILNSDMKVFDGSKLVDYLDKNKDIIKKYSGLKGIDEKFADGDKVVEIWNNAFPLNLELNGDLYVVIDTVRPSSNLYTSAFGRVSELQVNKIVDLINKSNCNNVYVLGHHHIYTPIESWKHKFLELTNGARILKNLVDLCNGGKRKITYLHGHRHTSLSFEFEGVAVISSNSMKYQDC